MGGTPTITKRQYYESLVQTNQELLAERDALAARVRELEAFMSECEAMAIKNRDEWMKRAETAEARVSELEFWIAEYGAKALESKP